MPKFMCDSCENVFHKYNVSVKYYSIGMDFRPVDLLLDNDEWLYLVNFYGQLPNSYIKFIKDTFERVIVDNTQGYFQNPIENVDTLYSCRKYFGVPDGAFLYSDKEMDRLFPQDESFERMHFLLGRYERTASEFYSEYVANNHFFATEPIKKMSKLTENLLRGIDYETVEKIRTNNFTYLHEQLGRVNKLSLIIPVGAYMYPLYVNNGAEVRKYLQEKKIYIPVLWPAVFQICNENEVEYDMAKNILPLPVDQRYTNEDMKYLLAEVEKCLN